MPDYVETQSVARGVAKSDPVIIGATSKTRIVFEPVIHDGGVRGVLNRQNKDSSGQWTDVTDADFRKPGTAVSILLDTNTLKTLYDALTKLYAVQENGVMRGIHDYVVARKDEIVITNENLSQVIQELIDQNHSETFWQTLVECQSDLAVRLAESQIQRERTRVIEQFASDIGSFADDEKHWQTFFSSHPWILQSAFSFTVFQLQGETYLGGKSSRGRNGHGGVATDFLFQDESTQSFAVIDIKTPNTTLMAKHVYRGKEGTSDSNIVYPVSGHLSGGVIQVRTQISEAIQNFESILVRDYPTLNKVHPQGVLVIGNYNLLNEEQKKSFNHFRHGLYGLNIITFDELLHRLQQLYCLDDNINPAIDHKDYADDITDPWADDSDLFDA